jgi:uncharacterized membrane protein
VFGVLVALLAILQAQAIPAANKEVEFNHNQDVQGDIIELQESASRTGALGTTETVKLQAGTTYPSRLLFFNPTPPSGSIQTAGGPPAGPNVELRNVKAQDSEIQQYLDGSVIDDLETKRFLYTPNYNEYRNSPNTTLQYGVLYNQFDNGENVIVNEGSVVRGNQITLTFFGGDLSEGRSGAVSLETRPASAPARTVTVEPDGGNDIEIKLPTQLSAESWENDILDDELAPSGNVIEVRSVSGEDAIILVLDGSQGTYDLRMSVVGIGPDSPDPDSEYMISESGSLVRTGQSTNIPVTFEVRDKYNNPVSDETIDLNLNGKGSLQSTTITTDRQGRATVVYVPTGSGTDPPYTSFIQASYDIDPQSNPSAFDPSDKEAVEVEVQVSGRPSGPSPNVDSFSLNSDDSTCVDTGGGAADTSIFGEEATQLSITWAASIPSAGELDSARIEMTDASSGQRAASTRYSLNGQNAGDTVLLRDSRPNDGSCDKNYEVDIIVESDGGKTAGPSSPITAQSGSDYPTDPQPA